jgi:hypothetical protein
MGVRIQPLFGYKSFSDFENELYQGCREAQKKNKKGNGLVDHSLKAEHSLNSSGLKIGFIHRVVC